MPLSSAPKCPKCGSRAGVRKIQYGMPAEMPDESKYAVGGCCVSMDGSDPVWTCIDCNESWGGAPRLRLDVDDPFEPKRN
jgi:hypothetical protein